MNTIAFTSLSKTKVVAHIWANKESNGFQGKNADLKQVLTTEELEDLYNKCPMVDEPAVVSVTTVEETTNVVSRFNSKGEQYFTIGLPLVETNGLSFRFQYKDKVVLIANDVDLYKIHKDSPIELGTIMHFNYEDADTFRPLTEDILVPNNTAEHRFRGTLSKSCNDVFAIRLLQKEEKRMQKTIAVMETAEELGVTTRKIRQVMSANLNADIAERMKAKLG